MENFYYAASYKLTTLFDFIRCFDHLHTHTHTREDWYPTLPIDIFWFDRFDNYTHFSILSPTISHIFLHQLWIYLQSLALQWKFSFTPSMIRYTSVFWIRSIAFALNSLEVSFENFFSRIFFIYLFVENLISVNFTDFYEIRMDLYI